MARSSVSDATGAVAVGMARAFGRFDRLTTALAAT